MLVIETVCYICIVNTSIFNFFFKWGLKARKYFLKTIFHEKQTFFHCLRKGSLGLAGLVQGLTLPHKGVTPHGKPKMLKISFDF